MNFLIGQKLVAQKEYGKALEIFLNLNKSNKKNDKILFYLGLIYFELNNFDKSNYYYNEFLKKNQILLQPYIILHYLNKVWEKLNLQKIFIIN